MTAARTASVGALAVAWAPTLPDAPATCTISQCLLGDHTASIIHFAGAFAFFGALAAIARSQSTRVGYVKPHGALYNAIVKNREQARAVVAGVRAFSDLPIVLLPGGVAIEEAENAGLTVVREAFADRGNRADGTLVPRGEPGAMLTDPSEVATRVVAMASGVGSK